jgi:RNA recognition motif-containing protein
VTSTLVAIKNTGELELSIEIAHPEFKFLANGKPAAFPLKIAAGKELGLEVRIPSQNKIGTLRDYLLIKSNDPVRSTLSIYISRYIITKEDLKELFKKYGNILAEKK